MKSMACYKEGQIVMMPFGLYLYKSMKVTFIKEYPALRNVSVRFLLISHFHLKYVILQLQDLFSLSFSLSSI